MHLTHNAGTFVLSCSFDERFVAKNAGFRWDGQAKHWYTDSARTAMAFLSVATPDCRSVLAAERDKAQAVLAASMATSADLDVPRPEGGPDYRGYQKAGIKFFLQRDPIRSLCGDEAGCGKTAQAIGLINMREDIKSVLIVAPATLKINWRRELDMWLTRNLSVGIVSSDKGVPCADILIVNYDILGQACDCWKVNSTGKKNEKRHAVKTCQKCGGKGFSIRLPDLVREYDLVVADEHHRLKNETTLLFRAFKIIANSKHRLAMSGTPLLNRPIELFSTLSWLDSTEWGNKWQFATRYCALQRNRFGVDMSGASNLEELSTRLRSGLMIRRTKKDVMPELPPKIHKVVELPADGLSDCIDAEWSAYRAQEETLSKLKAACEIAKTAETDAEYQAAIASLKDGVAASFSQMSIARMELAKKKIPYIVAHIGEMMEADEKIIVFGHHTEMLEEVFKKMEKYNPVKITGSTSMTARDKAVQSFQNDEKCRLFIGNIIAAGVGITLTASSTVVLAELDWRPGICSQAADRAHRLGQRDSVLVEYLVVSGSLDAYIAKKIAAKAKVIDAALGVCETIPEDDIIELPSGPGQPDATVSVSRKAIADKSLAVLPSDHAVVLEALRTITEADADYAQGKNSVGWSKLDSHIGHELSERTYLSPKQCVLGFRLAYRHKIQLPIAMVEAMNKMKERIG